MKIYLTTIILCFSYSCFSQVINFTDSELKRYLITESCVDTTNNGVSFSNDISVDSNNDGEIQTNEALGIIKLEIWDTPSNYSIKSLQDINSFSNLNYLKVIGNDSISEISNLVLDSLTTLWIGNCATLKIIDISNLTNLTKDLRIEDCDTLDYLNVQNGSIAQYFSLFYTNYIHYACVDSIADEYNELAWKMISGTPTINNCATLNANTPNANEPLIKMRPNPTNGFFEINDSHAFDSITIFDINGSVIKNFSIHGNKIDITNLMSGFYVIAIESSKRISYGKIVKM